MSNGAAAAPKDAAVNRVPRRRAMAAALDSQRAV